MTDNNSDWIKQANELAALSLWQSYCDKKMELEDANDRIEQLTSGAGGIMEMKQTIADKEKRIEQLEAALFRYSCACDDGECEAEFLGMLCGMKARAALEGKKDD